MKRSSILLLVLVASTSWLTTAHALVALYNNSNITTGNGNGANGANTSAIASTASTYGFASNGVTSTVDLAEDFTLASASTVGLVVFDAYSTSTYPSPPTSPFTGATVSLWSAQPGTAGATVLFTSSTLATTAWTGVYRVSSTALTGATRPVMTLGVSFNNVPLAAGTYWASWSVTAITTPGASGSIFTPPLMNTDGTMPAGDGIQSTDGGTTWAATADGNTSVTNRFPIAVYAVPEPGSFVWLVLAATGTVLIVRRRRALA